MQLSEFLTNLNNLVEEKPWLLTCEVITARDDEGNGFNLVHFSPTIGYFDKDEYEFSAEDEIEVIEINAVCIN
jgi:hypothetical protein